MLKIIQLCKGSNHVEQLSYNQGELFFLDCGEPLEIKKIHWTLKQNDKSSGCFWLHSFIIGVWLQEILSFNPLFLPKTTWQSYMLLFTFSPIKHHYNSVYDMCKFECTLFLL